MALIAMLLVVGGYGLAYEGICLCKGKDVSFAQMFNPITRYPALAGPFSTWPGAPASQVFPSGSTGKTRARKQKTAPASKAA
jgi:hypothetical protein